MENFNRLLEKVTPKLRAISKRLDGKYTSFGDDDLFQEAAFSLWRKYPDGRIGENTYSFILQGCYFFLKNYIRKNYKKIDQRAFSLERIFEDSTVSLRNNLPALGRQELDNLLTDCFLKEDLTRILTKKEREILMLQSEGQSTREIAKVFRISHVMVVKITKGIREKCKNLSDGLNRPYGKKGYRSR